MRRLTSIAVVIVLAIIVASPATASSHLVVASNHTTFGTGDGEPDPATLTNVEVVGNGQSASVMPTRSWGNNQGLNYQRQDLAATSQGGSIYAIGGLDSPGGFARRLAVVERYDPSSNSWTTVSSLNTNRSGLGAASTDSAVYAIGGYDGDNRISSVERYDASSGSWTTVSALPSERSALGAAEVDGSIFAVGGDDASGSETASLYEYDPGSDSWSTQSTMSTARRNPAVAAIDGHLYAIAGYDGTDYLSSVERYDPSSNSWTTVSSLSVDRAGASAISTEDFIYVVGGTNSGTGEIDTVERYNPDTDTWKTVDSVPTSRHSLAGAAVENEVYAIGGYDGADNIDTVESYELDSGSYVSAAHSASRVDFGRTSLQLSNVSADVTWEYDSGSGWTTANSATFTTSGDHRVDLSSHSSQDTWRVTVEFTPTSGKSVAKLTDEGLLFDAAESSASNLRPSGTLNSSDVTLQADVSDPDFGTVQGDEVTAEFYWNGSSIGTDTLTSNGTASLDYQPQLGGNTTWHVELSDSYGETSSSSTIDVTVPAKLRVYYETRPETLVDDANLDLRVQFYPLDDGQVRTRPVENGVVDLSGLPVNNRFVVTVRENATSKFVYRRIVIDNTFETQQLFLLSENVSSSQTVFELQDPTGQFPPEETTLYVEKPIEINNDTQYYVIAGDTFGATGRFPAVLENDVRYRLRLRSDDRERALGSYSPYGSTLETLKVQRIQPSARSGNAGVVYGSLTQSDSMSSLAVRFRDGTANTTVEYNVTDGDGNTVVPTTTVTGSSFAHVYELSDTGTQSYNVTYTVTYADGTTVTDSFVAGHLGGIADRFGMDAQVLSLMSWVGILATMGLVVIVNADLAPAAGTGIASLLTIIGTVAIPMPVLGMAGAVSVLTIFGGRG